MKYLDLGTEIAHIQLKVFYINFQDLQMVYLIRVKNEFENSDKTRPTKLCSRCQINRAVFPVVIDPMRNLAEFRLDMNFVRILM